MFTLKDKLGRFSPTQAVALSFFMIIMVGAFLLMTPMASKEEPLSFTDALFMSTSATCVTGLAVVDPGTRLTHFGQTVLLILIQVGGLGIMALSAFVVLLLGGGISIRSRLIMKEVLTDLPLKEIGTLVKMVIGITVVIESIGTLLLFIRFHAQGVHNAFFHAVFHSVSAYCNAGFSTHSSNLEAYRGDILVNVVIMGLIISGGLGFYVLHELIMRVKRNRPKRRLSLHTRVVITMTLLLVIGGAILYAYFERERFWAEQTPIKTCVLESLFQSVTPRTAGFDTYPTGKLTNPTIFLMMILMFIGAAPASTAGGIKVTTVAVMAALVRARFRSEETDDVTLMGRAIPRRLVSKSLVIFICMALVVFCSFGLLLLTEKGAGHERNLFVSLLFETISAMGTVGLSLGITPFLSSAGKIILVVTMYLGRIGPLTLALAVAQTKKKYLYQYPEEDVMVG